MPIGVTKVFWKMEPTLPCWNNTSYRLRTSQEHPVWKFKPLWYPSYHLRTTFVLVSYLFLQHFVPPSYHAQASRVEIYTRTSFCSTSYRLRTTHKHPVWKFIPLSYPSYHLRTTFVLVSYQFLQHFVPPSYHAQASRVEIYTTFVPVPFALIKI